MEEILERAKALKPHEIETLIADLAWLRSTMTPPVASQPPRNASPEQRCSEEDEPTLQAVPLRNGGIRLWVRNSGMGWLVFNLSAAMAITLRDFLIRCTDQDTVPDLFRTENDNRH